MDLDRKQPLYSVPPDRDNRMGIPLSQYAFEFVALGKATWKRAQEP